MLNSITIHGRLVRDPELRTTQSGVSVCSFTVAVDRSYARQGEEKQTDFFDVNVWRGLADMVGKYFTKGREIVVHGSMQSRKYQDRNGNNRVAWELQGDSVDFCGSKNDSTQSSAPAYDPPPAADTGAFTPIDIKDDEDLPF